MFFKTPPAYARFTRQAGAAQTSRLSLVDCGPARRLPPIVAIRCGIVAALATLATGVAFRFLWLDRLPGINGDEAWYGVQIQRLLAGIPWSGRTPSNLPINPLLFLTEAALLSFLEPSLWVLRLPIALWSCAGLALTYLLHRWVFDNHSEALLVTTVTACLPTHLAYSRLCWDSSFGFVSIPLVCYGLLELLSRRRMVTAAALLVCGAVLTLWAHVANAVFLAACLMLLGWEFRGAISARIARKPFAYAVIALAAAAGITASAPAARQPAMMLARSAASTFDRLPQHAEALGDVLMGPRVYDYLGGVPRPAWTRWAYPLLLAAAVLGAIGMFAAGVAPCDRRLVLLALFTAALLLVVGRALRLDDSSYERYVLYLVPLAGLLFVRSLSALGRVPPFGHAGIRWFAHDAVRFAVTLVVSCSFLAQFRLNYFDPVSRERYGTRLHRTFRTAEREPKAELAAAIRQRAGGTESPTILGADWKQSWWVLHPLQYLLGARAHVETGVDPDEIVGTLRCGPAPTAASSGFGSLSTRPLTRCFVVGASNSDYIERVRSAACAGGRLREELTFRDATGHPVWVLLVLGDVAPCADSSAIGISPTSPRATSPIDEPERLP